MKNISYFSLPLDQKAETNFEQTHKVRSDSYCGFTENVLLILIFDKRQ